MTGKQLRNSILQWAIQGKLVPQDPNDEPASVLLERIRAEKARLVKEKKIKSDKNETIIYRGEDNSYYEKTLATGAVRSIDDEIPFDIPDGWAWCRLEHITRYIQRGKSPKYSLIKQIPVVAQKCNQWSGFQIEKAQFIEPSTLSSYGEERKLQDGDLMWNSTGLGTLGRMAIYWERLNPFGIAVADSHVTVIRPFSCEVSTLYLYSYFSSPEVQTVIEDKADGSTKQKELSTATVKGYLVPLPPCEEQLRIVNKLANVLPVVSEYGFLQDSFTQLNATMKDNLYKSILQEAIQGKLIQQKESEGTAEELLEEIRAEKIRLVKEGKLKKSAIANESRIFRGDDNKYYEQIGSNVIDIDGEIPFDIPETWRWIRLGYVVDFSSNSSVKSENIHQDSWILDLEDIEKDTGILLQRKTMSESNAKSDKHRFYAGNILYSKLRPYLNKVLIADMDGYCTSEILAFDFGKINSEYALVYLRSPFFVEYAMSDAYGVKMPRLGSKQGNNALMPIPPLDEQRRIVNQIKRLKSQL